MNYLMLLVVAFGTNGVSTTHKEFKTFEECSNVLQSWQKITNDGSPAIKINGVCIDKREQVIVYPEK